jgi:hypothetical protein
MRDRFMTFERGVMSAHHQSSQEDSKRVILKSHSTAGFMVASCEHFETA